MIPQGCLNPLNSARSHFGNLNADQRPQAVIVFYSPQSLRVYSFDDDRGGALLAIGVDPVDLPKATSAFDRLSQLILDAASISDEAVKLSLIHI